MTFDQTIVGFTLWILDGYGLRHQKLTLPILTPDIQFLFVDSRSLHPHFLQTFPHGHALVLR